MEEDYSPDKADCSPWLRQTGVSFLTEQLPDDRGKSGSQKTVVCMTEWEILV